MNFLQKRCISFFKKKTKIPLGRWNTKADKSLIDLKVDLANHDSCGGPLCSSVPLAKIEKSRITNTVFNNTKDLVETEEEMLKFHTLSCFHLPIKK
jgi:hypothetical protein